VEIQVFERWRVHMNRREFLVTSAAARAQATRRPNLVYVFAEHCGYAGDRQARTPNIDRLPTQSFSLREAVSSSPVCAPYRATLMTGKYQSSTGMVINECG